MVELRGIVSCIKNGSGRDRTYFITDVSDGFVTQEALGNLPLAIGRAVEKKESGGFADSGTEVDGEELKRIASKASSSLIRKEAYVTGNADIDRITSRMKGRLDEIAALIIRKMMLSAPIVVRFHNDADGSGGAYALYLSARDFALSHSLKTNFLWIMQRGVSYSGQDAESDILITNNYECALKFWFAISLQYAVFEDSYAILT